MTRTERTGVVVAYLSKQLRIGRCLTMIAGNRPMRCTPSGRFYAAFCCLLLALGCCMPGCAQDTGKPTPAGPYYALVIGNDNYQFLPHLQTATNDARAMARILQDQYGFSTSLLLNATRGDILDAFSTYRRKLPPNSSLLVYYAGHGINDAEAKVAYWLPVDARAANNANWISADDITAELRVIKSLHILVVADSCYSGALLRGGDFLDGDIKPSERNYYIQKVQQIKSRNILSSGGNEPVADGGGDGHSIFAAVILASLRDVDSSEFTASSLFQRLIVRVAGRSQQTPQFGPIVNSQHDGGDFIFFRQPGKQPPPQLCCSPQSAPVPVGPIGSAPAAAPADEPLDASTILGQYRSAYENKDIAQMREIWPAMSAQQAKGLSTFFQTASSVSLRCELAGEPILTPSSATITFTQQMTYMVDGRTTKMPSQKVTMHLIKSTSRGSTSWKIESFQ